MKQFLATAMLLLADSAYAQVEFYGGDGDGRSNLSSEMNGYCTTGSWVFDDFDHAGGPITALWGNFLINYAALESVHYEIRSGIRNGNGGTLHAAGTLTDPTYLPTGRIYHDFTERYIKGGVSVANLPAGRYYMALQPRQTAWARAVVTTSSATDLGPTSDPNPPPTGTPLKNGNSWFHSEFFKVNYVPTSVQHGAGTWDYSYGVEIPEPAAAGLLALGIVALVRRR